MLRAKRPCLLNSDFQLGSECSDPPLPPKAKVVPWIGTTVDYIKFGPSSGERFHKELGPIYRYEAATAAAMDELRPEDMLVRSQKALILMCNVLADRGC